MNLPNKLTVMRVVMVPVFIFFFYFKDMPYNVTWALIVFVAAALTDVLDGKIARKHNLVTNFGKLMDPLADKLLVISAMVCLFTMDEYMNSAMEIWIKLTAVASTTFSIICLIIVISREFVVTSVRLVAAEKGVVIAADILGKLKTVSQMTWISIELLLVSVWNWPTQSLFQFVSNLDIILFIVMMLLTIISGFNYVWKNREVFADGPATQGNNQQAKPEQKKGKSK